MAHNVLLTNMEFHPAARELLEQKGFGVFSVPSPDPDEDTLVGLVNRYSIAALYVRVESITRAVFEACPTLRVVCANGVGVDNVDVQAATQHGVLVLNLPMGPAPGVAEHTISLLLALARDIIPLDAAVRAGGWPRNGPIRTVELAEKTLFILGFGTIGRMVAHKAQGLDLTVTAYDPFVSAAEMEKVGVGKIIEIKEGLCKADFVSVHLPLTAETQGLFGAQEFADMKPTAFFLSLGRGKIVQEKALYEALCSGKIAGAAMDVFEIEPPGRENPLLGLPNLIATPHVAGMTNVTMERLAVMGADSIAAALTGSGTFHAVNGKALEAK